MIRLDLEQGDRAWQLCAVPGAFDETCHEIFQATAGIKWSRRRKGYLGDRPGILSVCSTLQAAELAVISRAPKEIERPSLEPPRIGLFGYQQIGASWLYGELALSGSALLADEMGLGKSAQAIAAAEMVVGETDPILIVAPASVLEHWKGQIFRWAQSASRFRLISYGKLQALQKGSKTEPSLDPKTRLVIFDELHFLSNPKALRSKAARQIFSLLPERPFVIGLTGTPMTARIRDMWNPLDLLWPGRFGTKWGFEKRYAAGRFEEIPGVENPVWVADGASHLEELRSRLKGCMLRRIKSEVALELPALSRSIVPVDIPRKAQKDLSRAIQAIGSFNGSVSELLSNVEGYKIKAAAELARDIQAGGGKPLLLTTRISSALELGRELNCTVVTGDVPAKDREGILQDLPVAVATIYSVTTGIDLTSYDSVIFVGLDWVPSTLLQAEARAHRIGQNRNVTVYYLIGRGTIDEIVRERILLRLDSFAKAVGAGSDGMHADLAGPSEEEILAAMLARMQAERKAA